MKRIMLCFLVLGLVPTRLAAQRGVADPVTGNAAINFYGRVIDQNGSPIARASVAMSVFTAYLASPTELATRHDKSTTETDTNGNFELTGASGHSLKIESIRKEGYKLSPKVDREYAYSWSGSIFHPDGENPVIFKMWKEIGAERLIQSSRNCNVVCDGRTNSFDLLTGHTKPDGNLKIACARNPVNRIPREGKPYDYELMISVVGGGIQPTEDEFTYLAPKDGYVVTLKLGAKAGDSNWVGNIKKDFYIKTADGYFGRLSVDWYADLASPTHLDWNCSINPSSSRNLER